MNLDESQRNRVAEWIGQGLKLSEIQNQIQAELGLRLTYMEVRFLVDDLKLVPKDAEPAKPLATIAGAAATTVPDPSPTAPPEPEVPLESDAPPAGPGAVSVSVDQITRPGAVVSGKVTFSDANRAQWYLDQAGRLGLVAEKQGYRPPAADIQQFQAALETELARLGL